MGRCSNERPSRNPSRNQKSRATGSIDGWTSWNKNSSELFAKTLTSSGNICCPRLRLPILKLLDARVCKASFDCRCAGPRTAALKWKKFWMAHRLRSEEHTSEPQSPCNLVCRLLLEKKIEAVQPSHI